MLHCSLQDVKRVELGAKTEGKVLEILQTGTCSKLGAAQEDPRVQVEPGRGGGGPVPAAGPARHRHRGVIRQACKLAHERAAHYQKSCI